MTPLELPSACSRIRLSAIYRRVQPLPLTVVIRARPCTAKPYAMQICPAKASCFSGPAHRTPLQPGIIPFAPFARIRSTLAPRPRTSSSMQRSCWWSQGTWCKPLLASRKPPVVHSPSASATSSTLPSSVLAPLLKATSSFSQSSSSSSSLGFSRPPIFIPLSLSFAFASVAACSRSSVKSSALSPANSLS